ncbi:hypothetical protein SAMN04489719_1182 [Agrococcus carbonis]|uniref:Uncharacterized protein n=1 Tax=Agrococcus carbonis TaxID=684552 RepID=A0A1H1N5Y3_9MICO|nr:hypothetical protein SAMN04489719_1182 [Agrococcus carbonis]
MSTWEFAQRIGGTESCAGTRNGAVGTRGGLAHPPDS